MNWMAWGVMIAGLSLLSGVVGYFIRKILPGLRTAARFADRVTGIPANHVTGAKAKPGLFEVLDGQNVVLADLANKVDRVTKQVENSHIDNNLRDDIDALHKDIDAIHKKLDARTTTTINVSGVGDSGS